MIRSFFPILLLVFTLVSCKNDPPTLVSPDMNDLERSYFEDYEEPQLKWGYIDEEGNLIIRNKYDDCRDFIDGIALTNYKGKWGYIDNKGNTLIEHQYLEAGAFKNGLALVKDFEGQQYFIDKSGAKKLELTADKINEFHEGLAVFIKGKKWGAFDTNGKVAIPARYRKLKVLNKDHVLASENKDYFLLDHQGNKINDLIFDKIYFESDLPYVIRQEGKYFILDESSEKIDISFDKLEAFKGELSLAKKDGSYQLIDIRGKQIKKLDYKKIEYAGEGKWKFKENGKWGLLDENGDKMTEAKFYLLNRFKEGFMVYGENEDSWGYLDSEGNIATKAEYPLLWDYHNGYARYISNTGFGFIDKNSEISLSARYFELRDLNEGLARAQLFW